MRIVEDRKTVLVVDDNRDNRVILSTILDSAGYRVYQASDGEEAVRLVRRGGVDVVLMDICMPGMDGWQATSAIRADPETAQVPVIAVTALSSHRGRPLLETGDWDGVLLKPIPLQEVLETVARCVNGVGRRPKAGRAPIPTAAGATPLPRPPGTSD